MFFQAVYFEHFLSFYTMQPEPPKIGDKAGSQWNSAKRLYRTFRRQLQNSH